MRRWSVFGDDGRRQARRPRGLHGVMVSIAVWGYVILLPWAVGPVVFWLGPILASLYVSFLQSDMSSAPTFVGLANYRKAFCDDELFWPSLNRTFVYSLVVVPVGLTGALALATLLNRGIRGTAAYRTFFFLPNVSAR